MSKSIIVEKNMIEYGLSMQNMPQEVPAEVAAWLLERDKMYPDIAFQVEYDSVKTWPNFPAEWYEEKANRYCRMFSESDLIGGVHSVYFPYLTERWKVKIIGAADIDGNIISMNTEGTTETLPAEVRNEIAGLPQSVEQVGEGMLGMLRDDGDEPDSKGENMTPLTPDMHMTSDAQFTGEEFLNVLIDPSTKESALTAIQNKDWKSLNNLKETRH